ncbi:MAG: type II toxin-antitoxin system CcdA family antitoxin [Gammaproteobacteria bacterium]
MKNANSNSVIGDIQSVVAEDSPAIVQQVNERESIWQKEYAEFVAAYNRVLEQDSLPLNEWRFF